MKTQIGLHCDGLKLLLETLFFSKSEQMYSFMVPPAVKKWLICVDK